jgi:type III secretion protein J
MSFKKVIIIIWYCILCLQLSGCSNVLLEGLSQQESNEVVAILNKYNINAKKIQSSTNSYSVSISNRQFSDAVLLLKDLGYPRKQYESIGTLFKKSGMISSPIEEKARYVHGINEELSKTINEIDGVLSARVLVVIPEMTPYIHTSQPGTASVFVKYIEPINLQNLRSNIKKLVSKSIPNLDYDNVSIVTVLAKSYISKTKPLETASNPNMMSLEFKLIAAVNVLFLIFLGVIMISKIKKRKNSHEL